MFEYAAKVNGTFPKVLVMWGKSAWGDFNLSIFVYLLVLFGEQIIRQFWQAHLWALLTAYLGRLRRGVRIDQVFRTQRCSTELHSTDQLRVPKVYSRTTDFQVKFHFYDSGNPETERRYIRALISCPIISIILHIPRRHLENMEKLIPVLKWSICDIWRHFESKLKRTIVPCTKCCCSVCLWKQQLGRKTCLDKYRFCVHIREASWVGLKGCSEWEKLLDKTWPRSPKLFALPAIVSAMWFGYGFYLLQTKRDSFSRDWKKIRIERKPALG